MFLQPVLFRLVRARSSANVMGEILENVEEIVLAVKDQKRSVALLEELFGLEFNRSWTVPIDSMKVECAMIGDTQFHIVASTSPDTLIYLVLENPVLWAGSESFGSA
jgi:hypothetical protein